MNIAIKILSKLALLVALLTLMNFVYVRFFFEKDLQKQSKVINKVRAIPMDTDILYMGESSNTTFSKYDFDKRSISGMLQDYFPSLKIHDITKPASHAGIYTILLDNLPEATEIKTVIVTLNLRSFNADWIYSKLETSLQKSMVLLRDYPPLVNRFQLSFKDYDIKIKKQRTAQIREKWAEDKFSFPYSFPYNNVIEWDYAMATKGVKNHKGEIDYKATELACHFIKSYAFQIDTSHNIRIKEFDKLIALSKKRGWDLVMNLMAENTEKAEKLVGDDLLYLMNENRKILIAYFNHKGIKVVDNLNAVADKQFIDQNWTTEHYAEIGRRIIANNMATELKKSYPSQYQAPHLLDYSKVFFENNGEQKNGWDQTQTLSNEIVFSGELASKTDKENKYSLTFSYPIRNINTQLTHGIDIDFQVFQTIPNDSVKLVIELTGKYIENIWHGEMISSQITETKTWTPFHYHFKIPQKAIFADLVKIYIYNPSINTVYFDDIKIRFKKE